MNAVFIPVTGKLFHFCTAAIAGNKTRARQLDRVQAGRRAMSKSTENALAVGSAPDVIRHDHNQDGIDRRGFLKCMAWAGAGAFCVMQGGVLRSYALVSQGARQAKGEISFVQISDSHMGFNKAANPDVAATLQAAIDKINALPQGPAFLLHTGDITHLSKPGEFDTVDQMLRSVKVGDRFFVPGEHDVLNDDGAQYRERYGKGAQGSGWYSFDKNG